MTIPLLTEDKCIASETLCRFAKQALHYAERELRTSGDLSMLVFIAMSPMDGCSFELPRYEGEDERADRLTFLEWVFYQEEALCYALAVTGWQSPDPYTGPASLKPSKHPKRIETMMVTVADHRCAISLGSVVRRSKSGRLTGVDQSDEYVCKAGKCGVFGQLLCGIQPSPAEFPTTMQMEFSERWIRIKSECLAFKY